MNRDRQTRSFSELPGLANQTLAPPHACSAGDKFKITPRHARKF
jgi:hypothetical protein